MANPFAELKRLLPDAPLQIGTVVAVEGGSLTVEGLDGRQQIVRGAATVGAQVYHRGGAVEGDAPSLPVSSITL